MQKLRFIFLLVALCFTTAFPRVSARVRDSAIRPTATTIPAPREILGFTPGDDRKLAAWADIVAYFKRLSESSNRVRFQKIGTTTLGRPFVFATISAPENLARLEEYKEIQRKLADPRLIGPNREKAAAELITQGKTIVLITCGIHSTEVGSTLSSMLIAERLATAADPETLEILKNTIILLVPSLNPDGVDIVKAWYDKTLGTPYEGTDPPELYHKYTGHDNNRDWYAFTQVETQLTVDNILNVWHPQIVHDIHQQGAFGSRLFLPPYMQPVEPNVPKQIVQGYTELGNYIAAGMRAAGFQGVTTDSTYDAWSPSRAYSHYHGGVRILSETASAKLASPINIKFDELRPGLGYDPRKEAKNFGPVWQGGEWHLRNITETMTSGAFLLLNHAAEHRSEWLQRFYEIGREAVRPRAKGKLSALLVDRDSDGKVAAILTRAGVKIEHLNGADRLSNGIPVPTGAFLVRMDQPYGLFAKAVLEPQHYPTLLDASGNPIAPYDVTAHSLSLLEGVNVKPLTGPINYKQPRIIRGGVLGCRSGIVASGFYVSLAVYKSEMPSIDEGWTRWMLDQTKVSYIPLQNDDIRAGKFVQQVSMFQESTVKVIVFPDQNPRNILNGYAPGTMPPEYTGGLAGAGVDQLRKFVEGGGTLVFLNRSSDFAIEQFNLPLRDVTEGLKKSEFYVPGSILRTEVFGFDKKVVAQPSESIAWAEDSPAFEISDPSQASRVHVVARYPTKGDPLLSGWLLGGERLKGKAALVEVTLGKGRIILFGFRPQYRGQSVATYGLFLEAIAQHKTD
ncbi:MAG: hypothetical protein QOH96_1826 [Blastocatellia bacterium]|nr:hypothetical protein [Blastocatellia bacterium]